MEKIEISISYDTFKAICRLQVSLYEQHNITVTSDELLFVALTLLSNDTAKSTNNPRPPHDDTRQRGRYSISSTMRV